MVAITHLLPIAGMWYLASREAIPVWAIIAATCVIAGGAAYGIFGPRLPKADEVVPDRRHDSQFNRGALAGSLAAGILGVGALVGDANATLFVISSGLVGLGNVIGANAFR